MLSFSGTPFRPLRSLTPSLGFSCPNKRVLGPLRRGGLLRIGQLSAPRAVNDALDDDRAIPCLDGDHLRSTVPSRNSAVAPFEASLRPCKEPLQQYRHHRSAHVVRELLQRDMNQLPPSNSPRAGSHLGAATSSTSTLLGHAERTSCSKSATSSGRTSSGFRGWMTIFAMCAPRAEGPDSTQQPHED